MKKTFIYTTLSLIITAALISCTKSDTTASVTPSGASFTLRGYNYNIPSGAGYTTFQVANGLDVMICYGQTSDNKAKAFVYAGFYGTSKPVAGTYNVVGASPTAANQVFVSALDSISVAKEGIFNATGTDKVTATVAVDAAGKITLTLPTIQLSGSNVDNTNPSNTVSTNITTTLSGTLKEQ